MPQTIGSVSTYSAKASLAWYLALILTGTLALAHGVSHADVDQPITLLEAAFTATSAACVTGLSVRSTEFDFSVTGQLIILILIQLGGIGIMTVTTLLMFRLGNRQGLRARAVVSETLGANDNTDLHWILTRVIGFTLCFEGLGFVILAADNLTRTSWPRALWQAMFHSVSAFCNAGFSLHHTNLEQYRGNLIVNLTISCLIIVGGIGFPVIFDIRRCQRGRDTDRWHRLQLHSKLMLIGTAALLVTGTVAFVVLEWDGTFRDLTVGERVTAGFFHAVSCRTAGFNTINLATLTNASLFISILLMAMGAGPCSTGGGIKVSTIMVLVTQAISTFRGQRRLKVFRRTIPRTSVDRATATLMLFTVVAAVALTLLLVLEQSHQPHNGTDSLFLDTLFEVVSALGTVGLSTGMTTQLTDPGLVVIIILMVLGRLGPISVFVALSRRDAVDPIVYADEEPLIG